MFKINQKVRVVRWLDMPEDAFSCYSINTTRIGEIGTVTESLAQEFGMACYNVIFEGDKYPIFFFRPELEPTIKVGEQLIFDFIKEE